MYKFRVGTHPAGSCRCMAAPILSAEAMLQAVARQEWQQLHRQGMTRARLMGFHSRYKYLLLSRSPDAYRRLGRLLGLAGGRPPEALGQDYIQSLLVTLGRPASRQGHTNVLQHLQGYFKRQLSSPRRQALASVIHQYRQGLLPLRVPLALIRRCLHEFPNPYLAAQIYLHPPLAAFTDRDQP